MGKGPGELAAAAVAAVGGFATDKQQRQLNSQSTTGQKAVVKAAGKVAKAAKAAKR